MSSCGSFPQLCLKFLGQVWPQLRLVWIPGQAIHSSSAISRFPRSVIRHQSHPPGSGAALPRHSMCSHRKMLRTYSSAFANARHTDAVRGLPFLHPVATPALAWGRHGTVRITLPIHLDPGSVGDQTCFLRYCLGFNRCRTLFISILECIFFSRQISCGSTNLSSPFSERDMRGRLTTS